MIYKLYEKHPTFLDPLHVLGWWSLSFSRNHAILTIVLVVWIIPEVFHVSLCSFKFIPSAFTLTFLLVTNCFTSSTFERAH